MRLRVTFDIDVPARGLSQGEELIRSWARQAGILDNIVSVELLAEKRETDDGLEDSSR